MHGPSPSLRQVFAAELPRLHAVAYYMSGNRPEAFQRLLELVQLPAAANIFDTSFATSTSEAPPPGEALLLLLIRHLEVLLGRKAEQSLQILDDILRDEITHPIDLDTPGIDGDFNRVHPLLWELKRTCLTSVLGCLPPGLRISFILADLLGYTPAASAGLLAINESAFRVRLTRARKRLDNHLAPMCQFVDKANPCNCEGRLGGALTKGFISFPPHTGDIPKFAHDAGPEFHEMGALYRGLPEISLSAEQRQQLLDACSAAAEPLEIDIDLDNLNMPDTFTTDNNHYHDDHRDHDHHDTRSLGPIEPDHPAGPDEPAQPDDPIAPGPEPIPVPHDPA